MSRACRTLLLLLKYHELMRDLCVGCGVCISLCPSNAINIEYRDGVYIPAFNYSHCSYCGVCIRYCPALSSFFRRDPPRIRNVIGDVYKVYFCYAADPQIRYRGASGGVVTSLLIYMLEHGVVDKVLVVRMGRFIARPLLTDSKSDILAAQGSVYFKTFSLMTLREVVRLLKQGKRVCIVSLPCQAFVLRNILKAYEDKLYIIALVCYSTNELWYLPYFASKYVPRDAKLVAISSRGWGWPGIIKLYVRDKSCGTSKEICIPQTGLWRIIALLRLTAPLGCLICDRHLAPDADIVAGDAWHPKFMGKDHIGTSIVIVRTPKGLSILENALKHGILNAEEATLQDLLQTCMHHIIESARYAHVRRKFLRDRHIQMGLDNFVMAMLVILNKLCKFYRWARVIFDSYPVSKLLKLVVDLSYFLGKRKLSR